MFNNVLHIVHKYEKNGDILAHGPQNTLWQGPAEYIIKTIQIYQGGTVTMKGFISEFKDFINKGNVMDMAVGIIIGGAFTAIITALVENILMPIIGMIIGGVSFEELSVTVGTAELQYGLFIQAVINFLLIALTVFIIIKNINKLKKEEPAEEEPEETPADIALLTEIRDLLKK